LSRKASAPPSADQRIGELEAELEQQRRALRDQAALYRMATMAAAAEDMQAFYEGLHAFLRDLVYADNIYVALYDEARGLINWAYYVDSVDTDVPDAREWVPLGEGEAKGVTSHILRTGKVIHTTPEQLRPLIASGMVEQRGEPPVDYLGVPLQTDGHTVGVLAVQSYVAGKTYSKADE
jgi:transcriptional regulator with GAF, ATPase, and Fis domain